MSILIPSYTFQVVHPPIKGGSGRFPKVYSLPPPLLAVQALQGVDSTLPQAFPWLSLTGQAVWAPTPLVPPGVLLNHQAGQGLSHLLNVLDPGALVQSLLHPVESPLEAAPLGHGNEAGALVQGSGLVVLLELLGGWTMGVDGGAGGLLYLPLLVLEPGFVSS